MANHWGLTIILASVTIDKAKQLKTQLNRKTNQNEMTTVHRDSVFGFVQDKIHINDHWDLTPALRFSHYSDFVGGTYSHAGGDTI